MNIEHLREFVYLSEVLSFKETSNHFFISQSVLSKHIAAIEEDLGAKLFDRDRRHVELTQVGKVFHDDCLVVLNDYDRAISQVEALSKAGRCSVRFGYLRGAASPFLGKFVQYMERYHPDIELRLVSMEFGELIRALKLHQVDVAFSIDFDDGYPKEFKRSAIYQDKFYAVVSRTNPLAEQVAGVNLDDLADAKFLVPRQSSYPGLSEFMRHLLPEGCDDANLRYYDDIDTLFMRIKQGDYIGFSSGHNIHRYHEDFAFLPLLDRDTSYEICAKWSENRIDPAALDSIASGVEHCRKMLVDWEAETSNPE